MDYSDQSKTGGNIMFYKIELKKRSLSKLLSLKLKTNIYTLDLRNHGDSPHANSMTIAVMANDVSHFLTTQNMKSANILGHSMLFNLLNY